MTLPESHPQRRRRMVECLHLVAADAEVQERSLPDGVCKADEIALTFHDEFRSSRGNFSGGVLLGLEEIDLRFDELSAAPEQWTPEALSGGSAWQRLRRMARDVLAGLGEVPRRPNLR